MTDDFDAEQLPSKTQRKREAHEQQALGEELSQLTPQALARLDLPERLLDAIETFQRLPNRYSARRRQLQFIGKLMRDSDTEAIRAQLEGGREDKAQQDRETIEAACEEILAEGDTAINRLLDEHPSLERQALRRHLLAWQRADEEKKPAELTRLRDYLRQNL